MKLHSDKKAKDKKTKRQKDKNTKRQKDKKHEISIWLSPLLSPRRTCCDHPQKNTKARISWSTWSNKLCLKEGQFFFENLAIRSLLVFYLGLPPILFPFITNTPANWTGGKFFSQNFEGKTLCEYSWPFVSKLKKVCMRFLKCVNSSTFVGNTVDSKKNMF